MSDIRIDRRLATAGLAGLLLPLPAGAGAAASPLLFDVRRHGARGDGRTIDSGAINAAIRAAHTAGGGTVAIPAGRYLCFSIRLLDRVTLYLGAGAVIEAADPATHGAHYDVPENDLDEQFQDFGITHVHNSLIYADGATNIAILGPGMLHGLGLDREGPGDRWHKRAGWQSPAALGLSARDARLRDPAERAQDGRANKTIGMRNCRNVLLRDFTILQGGHFGVIVHGLTNLAIDNLTIDTDRDGIDVDCSRDVRITDCLVNAPKDDAIVLKSSYALGRKVACEDVTIRGCKTSGYRMGTLLDGSYQRSDYVGPDRIGPLGRIKLGTESNGGFRNIQIVDCTCTDTRGILIGVVDGGTLEDVRIAGIVLHDPVNHPLFVHQAARLRAPVGTPVGRCRRVRFSDIMVSGADPRYPCGVAGIADAPVEDIAFDGIHVQHRGGGTAADAALVPPDRRETSLEVSFMGPLPAFGFFGRHARGLTLRDLRFTTDTPDARPAIALDDVRGAIVDGIASQRDRAGLVAARASRDIAIGRVERLA